MMNSKKVIVGPIFEKTLNSDGAGIAGFIELPGKDKFINHTLYYTTENHSRVLAELKNKREMILISKNKKVTE